MDGSCRLDCEEVSHMSAKTTAPVSSSLLDSLITADTLAERLG